MSSSSAAAAAGHPAAGVSSSSSAAPHPLPAVDASAANGDRSSVHLHPAASPSSSTAAATNAQPSTPSSSSPATAAVESAASNEQEQADDETEVGAAGTGAVVDMEVFGQLLEIDDDESHEFSKTLAFDYISQAETTFQEIDEALNTRDLDTLSRKGHFLKGSSAALGLQRVQHSCESMQHFGNRQDEFGEGERLSEDEALRKCRKLLVRLRMEQEEAKSWLQGFYKV